MFAGISVILLNALSALFYTRTAKSEPVPVALHAQ